jgi:two-component system OmpR family response regulator
MTSKCALDQAGISDVEREDQGLRCASPRDRRILAVEDDDLMLELLSGVLGAERYTVDAAQTCEEALRYALFRDYATILLDLILPDGNGLHLFRQISRRRPAFRERVIFVTGALSRREAHRLSKLVDNPLILKPFRLEDLVSIVQRVARYN